MNPALKGIWEHIRHLGLGALAHANSHAVYAPIENPSWPELSIVQAAHAAELLIKARIAEEHPLLIFEQLPRLTQSEGPLLDLQDLFRQGKTVQWVDLPDRLWAATGISLPERTIFDAFGKLRNGIQHFGPSPKLDANTETLQFIYKVIDPFINQCWELFAIDFDEDCEPYDFVGSLIRREILFLIPPDAAREFENWDADWSGVSEEYRKEMHERVKHAKEKTEERSERA